MGALPLKYTYVISEILYNICEVKKLHFKLEIAEAPIILCILIARLLLFNCRKSNYSPKPDHTTINAYKHLTLRVFLYSIFQLVHQYATTAILTWLYASNAWPNRADSCLPRVCPRWTSSRWSRWGYQVSGWGSTTCRRRASSTTPGCLMSCWRALRTILLII